jgi:hypothetical protein
MNRYKWIDRYVKPKLLWCDNCGMRGHEKKNCTAEYVGRMPLRRDLEVIPADEPNRLWLPWRA